MVFFLCQKNISQKHFSFWKENSLIPIIRIGKFSEYNKRVLLHAAGHTVVIPCIKKCLDLTVH